MALISPLAKGLAATFSVTIMSEKSLMHLSVVAAANSEMEVGSFSPYLAAFSVRSDPQDGIVGTRITSFIANPPPSVRAEEVRDAVRDRLTEVSIVVIMVPALIGVVFTYFPPPVIALNRSIMMLVESLIFPKKYSTFFP